MWSKLPDDIRLQLLSVPATDYELAVTRFILLSLLPQGKVAIPDFHSITLRFILNIHNLRKALYIP